MSFIGGGASAMDTEVFNQRHQSALKLIEKEIGQQMDTNKSDWKDLNLIVTYKLTVVSMIKEHTRELSSERVKAADMDAELHNL
jgi:hypothetical protein